MTLTQLYVFTVILPNAYQTLDFLGGCLIVAALGCIIISGVIAGPNEEPEAAKPIFKAGVKCAIIGAIVGLLAIPLPSEKQLYTMAGGYVATNAKDVGKLPDNVVKAANAWLEKAASVAEDKKSETKNEKK